MSDFKAKCTKFDFRRVSALCPRPLAGFKEPTSKGEAGKGAIGEEEMEV